MNVLNIEIGKRIKQARKEANLSQAKLAELIEKERITVAEYESGKICPPLNVLERIAEKTSKTLTFFVEQKENKKLEMKEEQEGYAADNTFQKAMLKKMDAIEKLLQELIKDKKDIK